VLWRSGEVVVRDLHSTNKTFVGDAQLEPDVTSPWPAGAPLRVGSFTLKWAPARTGELPDFGATAQAERPTRGGIGPRIECASASPKALRLTTGTITIGRLLGCEFVIADPAVSKRHCAVHWDGRQVRVEDLGSTNGTFLGEMRLESHQPTVWEPGTAVRIGPHTIQLAADRPAPDD
jgi:pSer/pThr/pTyr-binding forkhead associated (FHA) protein